MWAHSIVTVHQATNSLTAHGYTANSLLPSSIYYSNGSSTFPLQLTGPRAESLQLVVLAHKDKGKLRGEHLSSDSSIGRHYMFKLYYQCFKANHMA